MSIMLKRAKFEYLSENVISKLIQKKAIFIEVGRRMSIYNYYRYIIIMLQRNFMETLDNNFFSIEGNKSLCFMIYNFTIYYFMKLFEKNLLLFRNKIETDIYVIIFDTIRYFIYIFGSTNLFCDNAPHDIVYYDEYYSCFLRREFLEQFFFISAWRNLLEHIIQFTTSKVAQHYLGKNVVNKAYEVSEYISSANLLNLSETLQIQVFHTWKINNWLAVCQ